MLCSLLHLIVVNTCWLFAQASLFLLPIYCLSSIANGSHYIRIFFSLANKSIWIRVLSFTRSKLRLCAANHRAGYLGNLACDCLRIVWAYPEKKTGNGPRNLKLSIYIRAGYKHIRLHRPLERVIMCLFYMPYIRIKTHLFCLMCRYHFTDSGF